MSKLLKIIDLLRYPGAIKAFIFWPKFSIAAFLINRRYLNVAKKPLTIIDVGANEGQFAIAAIEILKPQAIYSVEPDFDVAKILMKNLSSYSKAEVIVSAIGNFAGIADFYKNTDSQVSSLLKIGKDREATFPNSIVKNVIQVPINTLDGIFNGKKLDKPILLKIDVQGAEGQVIDGATQILKEIEWIIIEVAFSDLYEGECSFSIICEKLIEHGFYFVRPLNFHISPLTEDIIEMDALFRSG
jgi:FkbM family methyltransferase